MGTSSFRNRFKHAWSVFKNKDPTDEFDLGFSSSVRQDRIYMSRIVERSLLNACYTRISTDVASIKVIHAQTNQNGSFEHQIFSGLNYALTEEANLDQSGRAFIQDVVLSMFDEGVVAIIPIETTLNPEVSGSWDIKQLRTGKICRWYPEHIQVEVYNQSAGVRQRVILPKKDVAIVENPFYMIMNEKNSTLQRLIRKLNLLDSVDEQIGADKLDLIIQLPYATKTPQLEDRAKKRRDMIEEQLVGSRYGIAYADGTERIIQLNRPVENTLLKQADSLTSMFFSQLGLSEGIFNGTASETEMLNYTTRMLDPIISAILSEMNRKFITKTARTQGKKLIYFNNVFKLLTGDELSNMADKLLRNCILSPNEFRAIMGFQPDQNPESDELRNRNLNSPDETIQEDITVTKKGE